jgi:D-alanine-D-alanine ligase-like ATP-grasp enzyme
MLLQHQLLIDRALTMGVQVEEVSETLGQTAVILSYQKRSELFLNGVPASPTNLMALSYCDNKALTKKVFARFRIPFPLGILFQSPSDPAIGSFLKEGQSYVCKPVSDTNGRGVVMNIRTTGMLDSYYDEYKDSFTGFLLEEQVDGQDLRLQVIGGRVVAACIREPAFVMGNGKDSVLELISQRQQVMLTQNPENKLEIDGVTKELLAKQSLNLTDKPASGQKVRLKYVCNMAQGGVATDVTDLIDPVFEEWSKDLVDHLDSGYMGIDFIASDLGEGARQTSRILEINARADWLHHTFSERRKHDIPTLLLKNAFPDL